MEPQPKRGFAVGTNARDAALKNIQLGTAHRLTEADVRRGGQRAAERRWGVRDEKQDEAEPRS